SVWLEPLVAFTSCARVHLRRSGDHQTSATHPCPLPASALPSTTYPCGPPAAAMLSTPAKSSRSGPPARQCTPSPEVRQTRQGMPPASKPAGPSTMLVSAAPLGCAGRPLSEVTRVHAPAASCLQTAGCPSALPAASRWPSSFAIALTASVGAPAIWPG